MACVGFVDFGFLKAQGARTMGVGRRQLKPDAPGCVRWFEGVSGRLPGGPQPLLRLYWYDAAFQPKDQRYATQRSFFDALANTPGLQLRLGHLHERNPTWQYPLKRAITEAGYDLSRIEQHFTFLPELRQKGVDTLIALDLVRLAQRRTYDTAVLIAGDRDLAEPVRVAQDEGRRVIVAVPKGAGLAKELRQLADEVHDIDASQLRSMFHVEQAAE